MIHQIMLFLRILTDKIGGQEIILHAIQALDNITKSTLTKNLIKKAVLTPSLHLIDKSEIYSILDKNKDHPFLKISKPKKGAIFEPFEGIINLRIELKEMFEKLTDKPQNDTSAANKEADKQIKALNKKIDELKVQIKGLEKRNVSLKSELQSSEKQKAELKKTEQQKAELLKAELIKAQAPKEDPKLKAKIATIENQNNQLKENNDKLKKQMGELKATINQASIREKSLVEKLETLERSHEDLKEEHEYLARVKQQLKDEKDRLVIEISKNGADPDNLLGDTFRKMYFEQQSSK